ncbi:MAG: hypothetical protein ABL958_08505 [Bdellovibrionia bacterium]
MLRATLFLFLILGLQVSYAAVDMRALHIKVLGRRGIPVDAKAFDGIRKYVAEQISNGSLDKFVVYNEGLLGGGDMCIELSLAKETKALDALEDQIWKLGPKGKSAEFSIARDRSCR